MYEFLNTVVGSQISGNRIKLSQNLSSKLTVSVRFLKYQNRSPSLILLNCSTMIAVNVSPTSDPGACSSTRPPTQRSILSTFLYRLRNLLVVAMLEVISLKDWYAKMVTRNKNLLSKNWYCCRLSVSTIFYTNNQ